MIKTYPVSERGNKVSRENLIEPKEVLDDSTVYKFKDYENIKKIAEKIVSSRSSGKPVILFTGAHLVKNGLSLLLIDLVRRGMVTLVGGNFATAIHDFELSLFGKTSEDVPDALQKGKFGMAFEFNYLNMAVNHGNVLGLGLGESIGRAINDKEFSKEIFKGNGSKGYITEFMYPEISVASNCYLKNAPFTVHASMGTDVVDQHHTFDGCSKGACSARDFLIFVEEVSKLSNGGVYINIGSAVTGAEVLLKAVSMCANSGKKPGGVIFADFDLRPKSGTATANEESFYYYFRDQKSITTRIPEAFNCDGYYIEGNIKETFRSLYKEVITMAG
ncbi:MAG: hypothetical protein JW770_06970 [Actinobacteria bacterium]|nr:hypothetical protein [Actinomycetota bacterium]